MQRCEHGDNSHERKIIEHSECERSDEEESYNSSSEKEEECEENCAPFTTLHCLVTFCEAVSACKKEGPEWANLNDANFLTAATIAFHEAGANTQSWVGSWNGDDCEGVSLALSIGSGAPGGSINYPDDRDLRLPVLCQKCFRGYHHQRLGAVVVIVA